MSAVSTLIAHAGAREVHRAELCEVPAPRGTKTWFPVSHGVVVNTVESQLVDSGFSIAKARYAVGKDGLRAFATLDLISPVAPGVSLAVGIRNSNDQTFPISFAAGSRVFVCDNLAFKAESVVSRKHTRFGRDRFEGALSVVIKSLNAFRDAESRRITLMQSHELASEVADSLILQSFERGIIGARTLPAVIQEYRKPRHVEFEPRTAWSLLNAYTEALKPRMNRPGEYAAQTIQLQGLLCSDQRYHVPA
jgi:hypothetical protein